MKMLTRPLTAAAIAAVLLAAPTVGCNSSDAADKKESSDDEDDDKKKSKKKEKKSKKKEKKKDTSKACKADSSITAANKYGSLPGDGKLEVKQSFAYKSSDGFYMIQLRNFEYEGRYVKKEDWKDEWASVEINVYNEDKKKKLELATYGKKGDAAHKIGPGVSTKKTLLGFSGTDIGGVKIVHIGDDKICGELNLDDKYTQLKGHFTAKIVPNE